MESQEGSPVGVEVAVSPDRHVWTLENWPISQIGFDQAGVRVAVWKLDGSAEIRIGGRFEIQGAGTHHHLDAAETRTLVPLLSSVGLPLRRIEASVQGDLKALIGDQILLVRPDPRYEAWEVQGAGAFDGLGYLCGPGGGPPWGRGFKGMEQSGVTNGT